jgi:hypothetical protein
MRYSKIAIFFVILICAVDSALIYIPGIPIDPILIYQVQVACDRLEASLVATYGTAF